MQIRHFLQCSAVCLLTLPLFYQEATASPLFTAQSKQIPSALEIEASPSLLSKAFEPYINEITTRLPAELVMRLPDNMPSLDLAIEGEAVYEIEVSDNTRETGLRIDVFHCAAKGETCWTGTISAELSTTLSDLELDQQQLAGAAITLAPDVVGYLQIGTESDQAVSSVTWRQGNAIYTLRSPSLDRQSLLFSAQSMANASPIVSVESAQLADVVSASVEDEPDESLVEFANDDNPPPLPEGFVIDESGGSLSLSVLRPLPTAEVQVNSSVFHNQSERDRPFSDLLEELDSTLIVNSAAVRFSPELGRRVRLEGGARLSHVIPLSTSADRSFLGISGSDYNLFDADLGILAELDRATALQLGWKYQKLSSDRERTEISDHQLRFALSRIDSLNDRTFLTTNYAASVNFADRSLQNRWSNVAGIGLAYSITPKLLSQIDYQLKYTNFFEEDDALSHRLGANITYLVDDNVSVAGSVAYQFGESIDLFSPFEAQDFNNLSFGLHLNIDIPLTY